ncbi:MAG: hypothetical protein GEU98_03945 [Pseudonocardiaceae bacterium]|nr:hypothetical protein [Pseudonocardiaceae bacterium]
MGQLDAVDIKVLDRMNQEDRGWHVRPDRKARVPSLEEVMPGIALVLEHVLARLSTHGLVTRPDGSGLSFGGNPWTVTEFGKLCLDTMRIAGGAE